VTGASFDIAQTARSSALMRLVASHPDSLVLDQEYGFIARKIAKSAKVAIVSGGGSGHEPLHTGYVGYGMLDAACAGHYFTSPTPDQIVAAAKHVERGKGVLFVVKNYQGDLLNFSLAARSCPFPTETVLITDDVATRDLDSGGGRGLTGTVVVEKIVGAAAEAGLELKSLKHLGERLNAGTVTYGVALSSCRVPGASGLIYKLEPGSMEIGVGIHGERGRDSIRAGNVTETAALLVERTKYVSRTARPLMILNGLGGAAQAQLEELSSACLAILSDASISPIRILVGNYVTALDTCGYLLTLAALDDDALKYWDAPVRTAALHW
jgi:phosphoenolpyruvate---glycerone phosphotransferase subunit DhaK